MGSCSTRSTQTRSAITGWSSRPAMPSTCTGTPCSRSASVKTPTFAKVRQSSAPLRSGRSPAARESRGEPARDELGLLLDRLGPGGLDASGTGERRRGQRRLRDPRVERLDDRVGGIEDDAGIAPARRQVVHARRRADVGEVVREPREVGGARAAPSVDRLVGVADRHHRVPAEQGRQQPGLHDARVLVLVEQHRAGTARGAPRRPRDAARRSRGRARPGRRTRRSRARAWRPRRRRRGRAAAAARRRRRAPSVNDVEVGALARRLDRQPLHREEVARERLHVAAVGDVLGERAAEREHRPGDPVERGVELDQARVGRCARHRPREHATRMPRRARPRRVRAR